LVKIILFYGFEEAIAKSGFCNLLTTY